MPNLHGACDEEEDAVSMALTALHSLMRKRLLTEFNLEIGAGLGAFAGKVWRIGLMGYSARQENIQLCASALRHCLA